MSSSAPRGAHRRNRHRRNRLAIVSVGTVVTLIATGAGVGLALWLLSGSGTGDISSSSRAPLSVDVGSVSDLYPGATATGTFVVSNDNPYPVELSSLSSRTDSTCVTSSLSLPPNTLVPGRYVLSSGTPVRGTVSLSYTVSMPPTAPVSCASSSFHVTIDVEGTVGQ